VRFLAAAHISRVNCAETAGDRRTCERFQVWVLTPPSSMSLSCGASSLDRPTFSKCAVSVTIHREYTGSLALQERFRPKIEKKHLKYNFYLLNRMRCQWNLRSRCAKIWLVILCIFICLLLVYFLSCIPK